MRVDVVTTPMLRSAPLDACTARSTTPLERSILLAVLYGDVFDHPLAVEEIARYRPAVAGAETSDEAFRGALDRLLEGQLSRVDGLICWRGREAIVELRRRRQARALGRWRLAERYADWLRHVPFVRMAAVCGSQAMENAGGEGDLDFFLITARGRLWVVHFCAMLLRRLAGLKGVKVCPNYLLTLDSLEVAPRNLYSAREIAQTLPLWGDAAYEAFLAANAWVHEVLPHLDPEERRRRLRRPPQSPVQKTLELLLAGVAGQAADRALYAVLTRYYSLRWRRHGWSGAELRRAYRRDRQAVIGGGFGRSVADALRRVMSQRRGAAELEADIDRLLPAPAAEPATAAGPFEEVFRRHYGVVPEARTRDTAVLEVRTRDAVVPEAREPVTVRPADGSPEVLFGQSYYLRFDPKLWRAMQPYPPLGTLVAAAYLRDRDHDVALFDAMLASGEGEWASAVTATRPRFAVLFEDNFNYLSKMCLSRMRQASFAMLEAARRAGCTTIVCGSDATDHAADYLGHGAEYVIHGEGEVTLGELLDHLTERRTAELEKVAGISFRDHRGQLVRTAPRPVVSDLDAIPLPAWDLVDVDRYRRIWRRRHGYFSINMATTRGCPFHCNWCAKPIWGQTYHMRSPAHVVSEMQLLHERYRPDHLWFADDIMGLKRGWLAQLADALEEAGVKVPYKCLSRVDLLLRDGEIEALSRSGCRSVWVGAESGSQKILDAMEKGTRVEQIREAARRLKAVGVGVGFFLQFGYPGETREDIEATRELVRECRPDEIGISVSYPLPGTRFHQRVREQMGVKRNWVDSADLEMMYRGPFDTAFYRQLAAVTQKEFRLRAGVRELARVTRRPGTAAPRHLYRAGAVGYHLLTLPPARWKMERLARRPQPGAPALAAGMSAEEAARPSAQGEG